MRQLRDENGFTLMEVLVASMIGFIVLAGVFGLLDSTVRLNGGVISKTDAMQRGRVAMDNITQQLRSQVCLDLDTSAVKTGSTADSVTFYGDFTSVGTSPMRRTLTFDSATSTIRSYVYSPTKLSPTAADYPATPTRQNLVLENVTRQVDAANNPVPFFQYFAYKLVGGRPQTEEVLVPPLDNAEAARVARIEISYLARPTGTTDNKKGVNLSDQIIARHADPNLTIPDPKCV